MDDGKTTRARKPYGRWSADTERAFLLALKLTGQATKAAAQIGRSKNSVYKRRDTNPDFARAWDEAVAAQQAEWVAANAARLGPELDSDADGAGGGRLTPWRDKAGGWDSRKRGVFLRTLRRCKRVAEAAEAAGMSPSAAYYLRGQSPRFAAAWEKALRTGAPPSVIEAAIERAVEGWIEPIVAGGKMIGERRRYSDSLLRALLLREGQAEKVAKAGAGAGAAARAGVVAEGPLPKSKKAREERAREAAKAAGGFFALKSASEEQTNAALAVKLDALEWRRARDAAEGQEAEWVRWRACWRKLGAARGLRLLPAPAEIAGVRGLT